MTVLSEVESVSRAIGRCSAIDCITFADGAGLGGPDGGVCCWPASPPPGVRLGEAAGAETAFGSQTTGGSRYFFSPTFTENFCAAYFCVPSILGNQHCKEGSAVALIT